MADDPCGDTFRVDSASICGSPVYDCVGGSIQETVEFIENRPGSFVSACIGIDKYSCKAKVKYQQAATPVTRGTLGDTTFVLKKIDGSGTITVTVDDTRAGAANADFDSRPHSYDQEGVFDNGGTENLAAWHVGA
jgi:hypothetical protein